MKAGLLISLWGVPGKSAEDAASVALAMLRERGFEGAWVNDASATGNGWRVDVTVLDPWGREAAYPPATIVRDSDPG